MLNGPKKHGLRSIRFPFLFLFVRLCSRQGFHSRHGRHGVGACYFLALVCQRKSDEVLLLTSNAASSTKCCKGSHTRAATPNDAPESSASLSWVELKNGRAGPRTAKERFVKERQKRTGKPADATHGTSKSGAWARCTQKTCAPGKTQVSPLRLGPAEGSSGKHFTKKPEEGRPGKDRL